MAKKEEKDENSSQQFLSKKKQCKKERIIITRLLNLSERLKQRTFELKVRGKHTTKRRKRVSKTELQSSLCRETVIESGISWRFLSFACEINVPVFQMKGKRGYSVSSSCAASARFRLRFSLRFRVSLNIRFQSRRKKEEGRRQLNEKGVRHCFDTWLILSGRRLDVTLTKQRPFTLLSLRLRDNIPAVHSFMRHYLSSLVVEFLVD